MRGFLKYLVRMASDYKRTTAANNRTAKWQLSPHLLPYSAPLVLGPVVTSPVAKITFGSSFFRAGRSVVFKSRLKVVG